MVLVNLLKILVQVVLKLQWIFKENNLEEKELLKESINLRVRERIFMVFKSEFIKNTINYMVEMMLTLENSEV